jgi:hypothetical protein
MALNQWLFLIAVAVPLAAQQVQVRTVPAIRMPGLVDSNSPVWWSEGTWFSLTSSGTSQLATGSIFPWEDGHAHRVRVEPAEDKRFWIESVWQDESGILYAWYHHEPGDLCSNGITAPKIGALISYDNGVTFADLGFVLEAPDPVNCDAKNGYFGAGHGDFSVILDRDRRYFYFLFGNYGGDLSGQGIAVARMAVEDRDNPTGAVWKYYGGTWFEPGLGGLVTPVWPATKGWQEEDSDSFWGPSIHWNTKIEKFVVVMNRSCCTPKWPQEGVYLSFLNNLEEPWTWGTPARILSAEDIDSSPGYYVQVVGSEPGETDTLASQEPRLYVKGLSRWMLTFSKD